MTNNPQRILYIITKSNWGGAQRYVFDLAVAGKAAGHEVRVAVGGSGLLTERLMALGITVLPIPSFARDINLRKEISSWRELWEIIRAYRPDVVHVNSSKAGGSGALIARLAGVRRVIFTAHGWPFREPRAWWWRLLAWFFSYLTALLAHDTIVISKQDATVKMPGTASRRHLIYLGIEEPALVNRTEARGVLLEKAPLRDSAIWIGTIGELNANKNHAVVLEALRLLPTPLRDQCQFVVIGDGEARAELISHRDTQGLSETVHFLGFQRDAARYLPAFDIFILPSRKEGFPYVILEAGAAGLPVIASPVGGIPEMIRDRETGLLIDPSEPASVATALTELLSDTGSRAAYGAALQNHLRTHFQYRQFIHDTFTLYARSVTPTSFVSK